MKTLDIRRPTLSDYLFADHYVLGDKIVSKLTKRTGVVMKWPEDVEPIEGVVWVKWDFTGNETHCYRHQINRRV